MAEGQITDPKVKECIDLIKKAYDIYHGLEQKQQDMVSFHMDQIQAKEKIDEIDVEKE